MLVMIEHLRGEVFGGAALHAPPLLVHAPAGARARARAPDQHLQPRGIAMLTAAAAAAAAAPAPQGFVKAAHGQMAVSADPAELIDQLAAFQGGWAGCCGHLCWQVPGALRSWIPPPPSLLSC
jgi:hypothetical protein